MKCLQTPLPRFDHDNDCHDEDDEHGGACRHSYQGLTLLMIDCHDEDDEHGGGGDDEDDCHDEVKEHGGGGHDDSQHGHDCRPGAAFGDGGAKQGGGKIDQGERERGAKAW